jgi:hypothetical protein
MIGIIRVENPAMPAGSARSTNSHKAQPSTVASTAL